MRVYEVLIPNRGPKDGEFLLLRGSRVSVVQLELDHAGALLDDVVDLEDDLLPLVEDQVLAEEEILVVAWIVDYKVQLQLYAC